MIDKGLIKNIYFLSLFLAGLPPFFVGFTFLNVNTLAKVLWLGLFAVLAFGLYKAREVKGNERYLLFIFLAFFASQSLSILTTRNIPAFLRQYEDLAFTALFVVISFYIIEKKDDLKKAVLVLLANGVINLAFQGIIFLSPETFLELGRVFLHGDYLELISINIERSRIYFESYDEVLLPILLSFLISKKEKNKVWVGLYTLAISFISFVSNFRTRFLMLLVSIGGSLVAFYKTLGKRSLVIVSGVFVVFYIFYSFFATTQGFTVVDRILLQDRREDVSTVTGRFKLWGSAADIGMSSPVFGVGLGNFYDNLNFSSKNIYSVFEQTLKEFQFAIFYPHNIFFKVFAETGFLGLITLVFAFIYFAKKDIKLLFQEEETTKKAFAVAFWTLAVHALFNPTFTVKYQMLFWLLRVLVEKAENMKGNLETIQLN